MLLKDMLLVSKNDYCPQHRSFIPVQITLAACAFVHQQSSPTSYILASDDCIIADNRLIIAQALINSCKTLVRQDTLDQIHKSEGAEIICRRQSGMDGCIVDARSNLHAHTSFSGPFVLKGRILRLGACASHDIELRF